MIASAEIPRREGGWWRLRQRVLNRWITAGLAGVQPGWAVKTDLFDEACGPYHHMYELGSGFRTIGLDWNLDVARAAHSRLQDQGLAALIVVCDVRWLPFADWTMQVVLSLSTLDHFDSASSIEDSLCEIARVLRSDGRALLTLDNPWNPEVFLRAHLPPGVVRRLRSDGFPLGQTLSDRRAGALLRRLNLRILGHTYLVHGPRYAAIRVLRWIMQHGWQRLAQALEQVLESLERLSVTPLGVLTGHYVGWWIVRPNTK